MADWQPIETAPKDGIEVIVFVPREGVVTAMNSYGDWMVSYFGNYVDTGSEYTELVHISPTHWMPLPPPPGTECQHKHKQDEQPTENGTYATSCTDCGQIIAVTIVNCGPKP